MKSLLSFFIVGFLLLGSYSLEAIHSEKNNTEAVKERLCYAITGNYPIMIQRRVVKNNTLTFEQEEFQPVLLGVNSAKELILVGMYPNQKNLRPLVVRFITNVTVLKNKNFFVDQLTINRATSFVKQVICGP